MKSTRSLVVLWTCSLQLKTMRFTGQKYGTYGMKVWGLGGETMALLVRKYGSLGFAGQFWALSYEQ